MFCSAKSESINRKSTLSYIYLSACRKNNCVAYDQIRINFILLVRYVNEFIYKKQLSVESLFPESCIFYNDENLEA